MTDKELLQKAIRALQECRGDVLSEKADDMAYKAIAALKEAIAQPSINKVCRYPDCVDNGPGGKCIDWLTDVCPGPDLPK